MTELRNVAHEMLDVSVIHPAPRVGSVAVPVPLYVRVIDDITSKIKDDVWPVGHAVPKPADLADYYTREFEENVSAGTVRRSLLLLQDRGILRGRQGRSVVVARIPD